MDEPVLELKNFRKTYGEFVAVDDISFSVNQGEIFGLLGPNGAGKTSTLECLEGLRSPDKGTLRVVGIDPVREPYRLRNLIGVQLQSSGLPESITPYEAVRFFCAYHQVQPRFDLLDRLGITEKKHTQFYELSTGQQRRLVLALAVAHNPRVLFLDEPTAGLDVASRVELHALMRELKASGTTIILATHDMAEAEEMSDRVAILLQGKLVTIGTPMQITSTGAGLTKVSVRTQNGSLSEPDLVFPAVNQHMEKDDYCIYFSSDIGPTVSAIIAYLESRGDALIDLRVERPSLGRPFSGNHQLRQAAMNAFIHHFGFEFKTGIRNKQLLLMNYLFPLGFYLIMGLIMPKINPLFLESLIPALVVFGVLAATLLGIPDPAG